MEIVGNADGNIASQGSFSDKNSMNIPSVLYFLNCEARKYERDRLVWAIEKQQLSEKLKEIENENKKLLNLNMFYERRLELMENVLKEASNIPAEKLKDTLDIDIASLKKSTKISTFSQKAKSILEEFLLKVGQSIPEATFSSVEQEDAFVSNSPPKEETVFIEPEVKSAVVVPKSINWSLSVTVRSHLDSIKAVDIHPTKNLVLTASEDATIRLWNLDLCLKSKNEIEPLFTFREHEGPVQCISFCKGKEEFFSGGNDCTLYHWRLPVNEKPSYEPYGHTDIIWDVKSHPKLHEIVASMSADGSVKIWNVDSQQSLKHSLWFNDSNHGEAIPTSIEFLKSDESKILVAYNNGSIKQFDILSGVGRIVYDDEEDDCFINSICSSSINSNLLLALNNKKLKVIDLSTGSVLKSFVAHQDAVISAQFLYETADSAVSCSRDGSIRIWDLEKESCIQEFSSTHRRHFDETVMCLAYNSKLKGMISGGADSNFNGLCHGSHNLLDESTIFDSLLQKLVLDFIVPASRKRQLAHVIKTAPTFEIWKAAAVELDKFTHIYSRLEGNEKWKNVMEDRHYDYDLVKSRMEQLENARELDDPNISFFLLRTSLTRNFAGIHNPELYAHSFTGTKHLIENFNNELLKHLEIAANVGSDLTEIRSKIEFFKSLKHSYGNTALLLSGGGSLGLYHIGVIKSLFENKLLPRIVAGSSAGAIMASMVCTRLDDEFMQLLDPNKVNLNVLAFPEESGFILQRLATRLHRIFSQGILFDTEVLKAAMRENLGDITFLEAYNKTRRILNVTISSTTLYEMPRLLNYVTAPNVIIWSAVVASCAVPAVFKSVPIVAKDKNGAIIPWHPSGGSVDLWIDGSVEADLPMKRLSELFNVNQFIVSQVNAHVFPFLQKSLKPSLYERTVQNLLFLLHSELKFRLPQLISLKIFPKFFHILLSILTQKYSGDVTIVPMSYIDILDLFISPNPEIVQKSVLQGEYSTWPKIDLISNRLKLELKMDDCLYGLKCKLLQQSGSFEVEGEEKVMKKTKSLSLKFKNKSTEHLGIK